MGSIWSFLFFKSQDSWLAVIEKKMFFIFLPAVIDENEMIPSYSSDPKNVERLMERHAYQDYQRLGLGSVSISGQRAARSEPFRVSIVNANYQLSRRWLSLSLWGCESLCSFIRGLMVAWPVFILCSCFFLGHIHFLLQFEIHYNINPILLIPWFFWYFLTSFSFILLVSLLLASDIFKTMIVSFKL